MTTYYVRTTGSDGAAGTSAGAAWLTIGKAMTTIAAGDTAWVGAGVYRLSAVIAPSSMASMTYLYGDVDGSHTGDAGECVVTAFATNDTTAAAAINLFNFLSKSFWTVKGFTLVGGPSGAGLYIDGTSHDLTFQDLTIFAAKGQRCVELDASTWNAGQAKNLLIERCRLFAATNRAVIFGGLPSNATGADVDQNIVVRNCIIVAPGSDAIQVTASTNTFKSGGVKLINCLVMSGANGLNNGANISTTYPTGCYNNAIFGSVGLASTATTTIVENYNYIVAVTELNTVTQGANTIIDGHYDWRFHMGQELVAGAELRPFGMFPAASPMLTFGTSGSATVTDDILGGFRPGAGAASIAKSNGPYERNDSGTKDAATYHTSTPGLKIAGPGYHDFLLPVSPTATTVSIWAQYDGSYTGTLPMIKVLNGGEAGVANGSTTLTGSASTWTQMSVAFTPTTTGIVTIRLQSNSTAAAGNTYFDDFTVA